ncbi:TnpV protein [Ruminococcus sp. AM36-18]|nr:TnpV protein [Ruminococcus sp. AM36-18]RGH56378.1 TnpV protein [Ruminococcus sp. AM36-18]
MTFYEKQGGTYRKTGDYYLLNLKLDTEQNAQIGVWGLRHKRYLKQHHKVIYYSLLTAGKLNSYLAEIDQRAKLLFDETAKSLAKKENVTEELKSENAMLWLQKMNNIRNRAMEVVNGEVIYR